VDIQLRAGVLPEPTPWRRDAVACMTRKRLHRAPVAITGPGGGHSSDGFDEIDPQYMVMAL
jgi:hypothetical protein